jgi:hypothetical protein
MSIKSIAMSSIKPGSSNASSAAQTSGANASRYWTRATGRSQLPLLFPLLVVVLILVSSQTFLLSKGLSGLEINNPVQSALLSFSATEIEYPVEDPTPNPPPADGYNTFSACMLVMDDNHRLVEWMAYHYHVLPLRYMIVTVDPRSKTSPTWIFNRWRKQGVYIEEWKDRDFWRKDLKLKPIPDDAPLQVKRDRHRGRQKYFYRECLIALKNANRTWVSLHDSDEYLLYNHAGRENYRAWEDKMQARHKQSAQHGMFTRIEPSQPPPTTAEPGALIQYIRQEQAAGKAYFKSPCVGIPRLSFGAVSSTPEQVLKDTPKNTQLDMMQFDTLRWRRHAIRNDFVKNALGKVLVDVSRVDMVKTPRFLSLHRPIKSICGPPWHKDWESQLRINHYLGSWESYSFRDDARKGYERSREQWEYKASINADTTDDNIRPWLKGFVDTHGVEKAQTLLANVGLPPQYKPRNAGDAAWHLLPDKLAEILGVNETLVNDSKQVHFDAWVRGKYADQLKDYQQAVQEENSNAETDIDAESEAEEDLPEE